MEVCPVGFFCFDKNTAMLVLVSLVLVIVFYISKNNDKFNIIKNELDNNKNNLEQKLLSLSNQNQNLENKLTNQNNKLTIHNQIADEANYLANKDMNRVINPLVPPERSFPYRINRIGVPVNVPTRGYATGYQQVGVLVEEGSQGEKKLLPLFGQQTWPGSRQWQYYTSSDGFQAVKLPVNNKNRNCLDRHGCDEIYDGNNVNVAGYNNRRFKATIYKLDAPRYIPYIV